MDANDANTDADLGSDLDVSKIECLVSHRRNVMGDVT
jgi:hypothetical protein